MPSQLLMVQSAGNTAEENSSTFP